jgi:hypothetical protein
MFDQTRHRLHAAFALFGKIGGEIRIMTFNDPLKQVVFGLVALIVIRASILVAASCRSASRHELHAG